MSIPGRTPWFPKPLWVGVPMNTPGACTTLPLTRLGGTPSRYALNTRTHTHTHTHTQLGCVAVSLPSLAHFGAPSRSLICDGACLVATQVHTNPSLDDATTSAAAGYFEGFVTSTRLEQTAINAGVYNYSVAPILNFIKTNEQWMDSMVALLPKMQIGSYDQLIWYQVSLVRSQLRGMEAGYLAGRKHTGVIITPVPLDYLTMVFLQLGGDLGDLGNLTGSPNSTRGEPGYGRSHCSALFRYLGDDILSTHATWSSLSYMLRIYKVHGFSVWSC